MRSPDDARTRPLFTPADAARLARTSPAAVRAWFCGNAKQGDAPLFEDRVRQADEQLWLSFLEVVEVIVARQFRSHRVTIAQLRSARHYAKTEWDVAFPLAERRLKLLGGRVVDPELNGTAIDAGWPALQPALPELADFANSVFDYDADKPSWAYRFFPAGRKTPLVVDPRYAGGQIAFPNRRLRLIDVVERQQAGEDVEFIAEDFALDPADVEAALQFAGVE